MNTMARAARHVARCTDLGCPLYAVRPYQDGSGNGQDGQFRGAGGPERQQEGQYA